MKGAKMEGEKHEVGAHIVVCMISGNVGGRSPSRSWYHYLQYGHNNNQLPASVRGLHHFPRGAPPQLRS